jgi:hypothetical protein
MRHLREASIAVPITASNAHAQEAGRDSSIEAFGDLSGPSRADGSFDVGSTGIVRDPVSNAGGAVDDGLSIRADVMSTALPLDGCDNLGSSRSKRSRHARAGQGVGTEIDQDMTVSCALVTYVDRRGMPGQIMNVGAASDLSPRLTQPSEPRVFDAASRRLEAKNGDVLGVGAKLVLGLA